MSNLTPFARKVVYIVIIAGLLVPLSMISRPATRDRDNAIKDQGGILSELRDTNNLSPAKLSEIDPGSETMKLASLGLRGVAVNLLWMKAIEAKDKKNWDVFSSTLNSLVKIQPNFIKVWEYQGHNLSYNVSVEFDDYEQRYHWVKKGIDFLTKGIPYNRRDHRIIDSLGFFSGNKFGTADERFQYRRLFRNDELFHDEMSKFVNIDEINTPYDPDHWLLAYQWYDRSLRMIQQGVDGSPVQKFRKDMIYYQYKPSQLRNMGLAFHDEFRSDEFDKSNWTRAHEEWMEYGNYPIRQMRGFEVTLEGLTSSLRRIERIRAELDELAPGVRENFLAGRISELSDREVEIMNRPVDSLDDEEFLVLREVENKLYSGNTDLDHQIAMAAPVNVRSKAEELSIEIAREIVRVSLGDKYRNTMNYEHWKYQTLVESTEKGIAARQAQFDASELKRRSIFDQYIERDPITGEETLMPGAIQKYDEAFAIWADTFRKYPTLKQGAMMDDIVDVLVEYMDVRSAAGLDPWPDDMPLQYVIDYRSGLPSVFDDLPTSKDVAEALERKNRDRSYRIPERPNIDFSLESTEPPAATDEDSPAQSAQDGGR